MNRVENAELGQLLAATERAMSVATAAGEILARVGSVEGTAAGRVLSGTRLEEDELRADILYHGSLTWPPAFNAHHELAHTTQGSNTLNQVIDSCRDLLPLRESARHAAPGFLGWLFGGEKLNRGQEAAATLRRRLADPSLQALLTDTTALLERIRRAEEFQQGGIWLFPGSHGTPEHLIAAARSALATGLGHENPTFTQLGQSHIQQVLRMVRTLEADPNSEPRLRQSAEIALKALNRERVEILLRQLPVEALKTTTNERLRFAGLETRGYATVADVFNAGVRELTTIDGIGEITGSSGSGVRDRDERTSMGIGTHHKI